MKEKSTNLRFENDEPPVSPSLVKVNYIHCGENEAGILAKGEEVTREWLIQFISRR